QERGPRLPASLPVRPRMVGPLVAADLETRGLTAVRPRDASLPDVQLGSMIEALLLYLPLALAELPLKLSELALESVTDTEQVIHPHRLGRGEIVAALSAGAGQHPAHGILSSSTALS